MFKENNIEVWMKPLGKGAAKAIAILNRGADTTFTLTNTKAGVSKNSKLRDLWLHKELGKMHNEQAFTIPKHGIVVLKVY